MSVTLYTHEWELLLQFVNNIHASQNFEEFCQTVLKQLPSAISFKKAVIFKYGIKDGQGIICDPHTLGKIDLSVLMSGSYPNWTEYLTFPNSAIIRQSDKYVPEEWEQTDMYKDFFAPHGVYWCLMMSIVNQDTPLAFLGLTREQHGGDFSERDIFILNELKPTFEAKLSSLLSREPGKDNPMFSKKIAAAAALYGLTKQETEITKLICSYKSNAEISALLVIAVATLNKHISNIFAKTNTNNRIQLIDLIIETK